MRTNRAASDFGLGREGGVGVLCYNSCMRNMCAMCVCAFYIVDIFIIYLSAAFSICAPAACRVFLCYRSCIFIGIRKRIITCTTSSSSSSSCSLRTAGAAFFQSSRARVRVYGFSRDCVCARFDSKGVRVRVVCVVCALWWHSACRPPAARWFFVCLLGRVRSDVCEHQPSL